MGISKAVEKSKQESKDANIIEYGKKEGRRVRGGRIAPNAKGKEEKRESGC